MGYITITFEIPPAFAKIIAEAKCERAKKANIKFKIQQLKKDIKHYQRFSHTENIDLEKLNQLIESMKHEIEDLKLKYLN